MHFLLLKAKKKMDCFAPLAMTKGLFNGSSPMASGIARGDGGAAAREKDSYTKGHFQ